METLLGNIKFTPNVEEGVSKADLVIEAIVENVEAKRKLFTQVEGAVPRFADSHRKSRTN